MVSSTGCFVVPEEPEEPVESPIVCEGGCYHVLYDEWYIGGCVENDPQPAGTYWCNADGRMFLLGDVVWPLMPIDVYGMCPTEYIEEIFI